MRFGSSARSRLSQFVTHEFVCSVNMVVDIALGHHEAHDRFDRLAYWALDDASCDAVALVA